MPKLDWIGKQYVVNHSDEVPFRLLERVPEASMGEGSGNVIVHGDNLEALKRLV
jgi:adenine-specific DNA-methyltransferase